MQDAGSVRERGTSRHGDPDSRFAEAAEGVLPCHQAEPVHIFFLNEKTLQMNQIVCAHELGHDQLHREFAVSNTLQEFTLYAMNSIQEYEANVLAADLLLEDDAVLELIYDGYDIVRIAAELQSDVNLVALQMDYLSRKGHNLRW